MRVAPKACGSKVRSHQNRNSWISLIETTRCMYAEQLGCGESDGAHADEADLFAPDRVAEAVDRHEMVARGHAGVELG